METGTDRLRIDKWLWAARFFKTRGLAARAIDAGHVKLAEERVKPSKEIRPGDRLSIRIEDQDWTIEVLALSDRRGPAPVARQLYAEDADSLARREAARARRRVAVDPSAGLKGRPTKRDRRLIHRFTDAD
jgi:ribosome-associated heat shock protein Hsp15